MQIEGKNVVVTGGANGIGYCCVHELLTNGAKAVAIFDLHDSNGENVVEELTKTFGKERAIFCACDVANDIDFKENFNKTVDTMGTIDIFINNAGIMDDAEWDPMIDINFKGTIRGTLLALDHMGKQKGGKGGTVLNMSSVTALHANLIAPIYSGACHAILGFSLALQYFYDKTGVRVMTICPGLTSTSLASRFMASKEHAIDILDDDMAAKEMLNFQYQTPEHVAKAMIELLEKGVNGNVGISENNQPPFVVDMPHYSTRKVPL